jgi:HAD superfamily hydrolase (TIGR01509 family)
MALFGNIKDIQFNALLLDFDGVIANTEPIFAKLDCSLLNEILDLAGKAADLNTDYLKTLAGNPGEKKLIIISEDKNFNAEDYIEHFNEKRNKQRETLFSDHPPEICNGLHRLINKYKNHYGLATNKVREKIENDLSCLDLATLFENKVFCLENDLKLKPAPDILLNAAQNLNMDPGSTIYIGDNVIDIMAAKNAGMIPVGFMFEKDPEKIEQLAENGVKLIIDSMEDFL